MGGDPLEIGGQAACVAVAGFTPRLWDGLELARGQKGPENMWLDELDGLIRLAAERLIRPKVCNTDGHSPGQILI